MKSNYTTSIISKLGMALTMILMLSASALGQDDSLQSVQDALDAWYNAYNAGDAEATAQLYAPEAVRIPFNGEAQRGREAIENGFVQEFRSDRSNCQGGLQGFQVQGDLAATWGEDRCRALDNSGDYIDVEWMALSHRQDGEWLIVYEATNRVR